MVSDEDISKGDISALTEDQRDSIDKVLAEYGELAPYELREQTHSEAPWKNARGNLPDNIPSDAVISKESMGAYYGSL